MSKTASSITWKTTIYCLLSGHISQLLSHPNPLGFNGFHFDLHTCVSSILVYFHSSSAFQSVTYLLLRLYGEKRIFKWTQHKRGNQILIPLHMRALILERIDHRHRILIKCRERCRDAIWWSNFSQAVKRNVFSLQEAQALWGVWASHHSPIGCAPMVKAGKLL